MKQDSEVRDPDELQALREKKLRRQVRHQLYAFSPYFRDALGAAGVEANGFDSFSDLERLEVVRRADLANAERFLLSPTRQSIQKDGSGSQVMRVFLDKLLRGIEYADKELDHEYSPVQVLETLGTEYAAATIQLSRRDLAVMGSTGARTLTVAGARSGMSFLNLLEPSNLGAFWQLWSGAITLGLNQIAPGFIDPSDGKELAAARRAEVVAARADDAVELLSVGPWEGLELVLVAPEDVSPDLKTKLRDLAGPQVKVIFTYGFAEGRSVWPECFEGAGQHDVGFHTFPEFEHIDILASVHRGEILFTGLDQRGTALARYAPGDVAAGGIEFGRCPYCGRVQERIFGPIHRASNLLSLHLPDWGQFSLDKSEIADALIHPAVKSWQVEVQKEDGNPRGPDEFLVLFEPRAQKDPAKIAVALNDVMLQRFGFSPSQFIVRRGGTGTVVDFREELSGNLVTEDFGELAL